MDAMSRSIHGRRTHSTTRTGTGGVAREGSADDKLAIAAFHLSADERAVGEDVTASIISLMRCGAFIRASARRACRRVGGLTAHQRRAKVPTQAGHAVGSPVTLTPEEQVSLARNALPRRKSSEWDFRETPVPDPNREHSSERGLGGETLGRLAEAATGHVERVEIAPGERAAHDVRARHQDRSIDRS